MSLKRVDLLDLATIWKTDVVDTEVVFSIVTVRGKLAYKMLRGVTAAIGRRGLTPVLGDLINIGQQSLVELRPSLSR